MKKIQVDSFEVQLGAGMLIQLRDGRDKPITILADAGVHASGYRDDHVLQKLPQVLDAFSEGNRRIDLIVGTHYDADHLCGLPPIIRDQSIEIVEIWLPPVADDESPNPERAPLWESQYLAYKWRDEDGQELARDYLAAQWAQCEELRSLEKEALAFSEPVEGISWKAELMRRKETVLAEKPREGFGREHDFASMRGAFRAHLDECGDLPGDEGCDCHANTEVGFDDSSEEISHFDALRRRMMGFGLSQKNREWSFRNDTLGAARNSLFLAHLRKVTAANAITASHLAEVMKAISERGGISVKCRTIQDGTPVKLKWSARGRKFLPGAEAAEHEPVITLLGPSESLVKKHRDKLPVMERANLALFSAIPIKAITPSNQLSYILRVDHEGQGVLVTGDAGCVDYKQPGGGGYYPALVSQFSSLHVIQVAHHAGNNAHFYRVLLEEDVTYPDDEVFLILSHATDDKYRPSEAFGQFIGALSGRARPSLLFTSRPKRERVEGFERMIYNVVGGTQDEGDIRLSFDGNNWRVDFHAVQV